MMVARYRFNRPEQDEQRKPPGGRPRLIFTDQVLAQIPVWIAQGDTLDKIASRIGTTIGSLYVTCSRMGVSLRGANRPANKRTTEEIRIKVSKQVVTVLEEHGKMFSMTREQLVAVLLEQIVNDDLFQAVLDFETIDAA